MLVSFGGNQVVFWSFRLGGWTSNKGFNVRKKMIPVPYS